MYPSRNYANTRLSRHQIRQVAYGFYDLKKVSHLATYLQVSRAHLEQVARNPSYYSFSLPKAQEGETRLIEAPSEDLKAIQSHLNHALQCVYHPQRPDCAYGFVMTARDDPEPRTIYTNACQHLGKPFVLNIDLRDFFHSISQEQVLAVFSQAPFRFGTKAAQLLADLTTYQGRLPQGAPSSPVLSNLVCIELDQQLMKFAKKKGWTYTRFSDDLTFSSKREFSQKNVESLYKRIRAAGFVPQVDKVKQYMEGDTPMVTGLLLMEDYPDISPDYLQGIKSDLKLLKWIVKQGERAGHVFRGFPIQKFCRSIRGQINFVGFVRGRQHKSFLKLQKRFQNLQVRMG